MFKLNYVEKGDYKIKFDPDPYDQLPPVKLAATLIGMVTEEFDLVPELYELEEETAIGILYNNTCVDIEHFLDEYGEVISVLNRIHVITIQGEIAGLEEGKVVPAIEEDIVLFKKYNTTGRDFDTLKSIYLKIYLSEEKVCKFMVSLLEKMVYNPYYVAMEREWDKLDCVRGLYENSPLFYFRYINLKFLDNPEDACFAMIDALAIPQIMILWEKYIEENVAYEEFERVCEMYEQGHELDLFKWGIALNRVVRKKRIQVNIESNNVYSIIDQNGKKIKLGYNSNSGAEKLFIKFLFPNK